MLAAGSALAQAMGNLTSYEALNAFQAAANSGIAPFRGDRDTLLNQANASWSWGTISGEIITTEQDGNKYCHPRGNSSVTEYLKGGGPDVYAKALAYRLTGGTAYASEVRQRILDLVDTHTYSGLNGELYSGSNQCILDLAISISIWIESALLIADYAPWSAGDATSFKNWLAAQVYPKVAWASRVRKNNWGAAGSLTASVIANYVNGTVAQLNEVQPANISLSPSQAESQHNAMQLQRLGTQWPGDSQCAVFGVQSHGGIPDELRRGSTGCTGSFLLTDTDASHTYQAMHATLLTFHAEVLRRRGDLSLVNFKAPGGADAIRQSILFVIANPTPGGHSWQWSSNHGGPRVAYSIYQDSSLKTSADQGSTVRGGNLLPYTRITHPTSALAYNPAPRPPNNLTVVMQP